LRPPNIDALSRPSNIECQLNDSFFMKLTCNFSYAGFAWSRDSGD
jgi:hypothetical protein